MSPMTFLGCSSSPGEKCNNAFDRDFPRPPFKNRHFRNLEVFLPLSTTLQDKAYDVTNITFFTATASISPPLLFFTCGSLLSKEEFDGQSVQFSSFHILISSLS